MTQRFLAIDFETAEYARDSACAIGLALVENLQIVETASYLIRPPSSRFVFTNIHGITWDDVKEERTFGELWPSISRFFEGVDFIAAHNSPFDKGVLGACCRRYDIAPPETEFRCTLRLARKLLDLESNNLKSVSDHYGIELNHHEALSDTLACAKIMIEFLKMEGDCGLCL